MPSKSSEKRIEANRRNAQKSTGPRTPEGKACSARNATTHGLSSLNQNPLAPGCFLQIEDETKFLGLLNQYIADYQPRRQDELDLLTEAVYAKWKQQRLWLAETAHLELTIAQNERDFRKALPNADAPAHLANAIGKSESQLKLFLRYDAQLHRHYRNCLKDLNDLQDRRATQPPLAGPEPIEPKPPVAGTECLPPTEPNAPPTPEQAQALADRAEILRHMNQSLGRTPTT